MRGLPNGDLEAEVLRAWVYELKNWKKMEPERLLSAFPKVDMSSSPKVIFYLSAAPLTIETLIDFRTGVVLVIDVFKLAKG